MSKEIARNLNLKMFVFAMILTIVIVHGKGHRQKKYVIEVQSHNQALKSANPLVDLENAIQQGINDPFTDPRFIMNRINQEFFGSELKHTMNSGNLMTQNNLHNNELMAFHGEMNNVIPQRMPNLGGMNNFMPQRMPNLQREMMPSLGNPMTRHAIQNTDMPLRNNLLDNRFSDGYPAITPAKPFFHNPIESPAEVSHLRGLSIANLNVNDISAGKEGITAADLHKLDHDLNAQRRNFHSHNRIASPRNVNSNSRFSPPGDLNANTRTATHRNFNSNSRISTAADVNASPRNFNSNTRIGSSRNSETHGNMVSGSHSPVPSLDSGYDVKADESQNSEYRGTSALPGTEGSSSSEGGVLSSIASLMSPPAVKSGDVSSIASLMSPVAVKSSDALTSNPGSLSASQVDTNFSSLRAFLEADNTLRRDGSLPQGGGKDNPLDSLMHKKHLIPKYKRNKKHFIPKYERKIKKIKRKMSKRKTRKTKSFS